MLPDADDYSALLERFAWRIPERYNIGVDACDRWADGSGRLALIDEREDGSVTHYTFDALKAASNRLANSFARAGIGHGERIGIFIPQGPQTAIAHLATYKAGAIAVPLFALFGADALEFRLADSGASALVTDRAGAAKIAPLRAALPALHTVYCIDCGIDGAPEGTLPFEAALATESEHYTPVDTLAEDPAVIIYTSGTTGKPKGALHAQRVLLGHLPGVEMSQNGFPRGARVFWTPADWAWIGCLARRAAAGLASRRDSARAPLREVRRRGRLRADGAPRRDPRLPAAHRAEADAPARGGHARRRRCSSSRAPAAANRSAPACSTGAARCSA